MANGYMLPSGIIRAFNDATTQGPQRLDAVSCVHSLSFGIIPTVSLNAYRWRAERAIDSLICARATLCLTVA